eukprot:6210910-Pleurochrysis_carterae.AAC.3
MQGGCWITWRKTNTTIVENVSKMAWWCMGTRRLVRIAQSRRLIRSVEMINEHCERIVALLLSAGRSKAVSSRP